MNGVGIDIIEVKRIENSLIKPNFIEKVFLPSEIEYCNKFTNKAERFAGMFACKEAVMKACQFAGQYFLNIEVTHQTSGAPEIKLYGLMKEKFNENKLKVSISHIAETAVAIALYE